MEYTEYALCSDFVQKYAVNGNGLPQKLDGNNIITSSHHVVVLDMFLRNHQKKFSELEISEKTGVEMNELTDILYEFQKEGILTLDNSLYTLNYDSEFATEIRKHQKQLL